MGLYEFEKIELLVKKLFMLALYFKNIVLTIFAKTYFSLAYQISLSFSGPDRASRF